jgi:hypothetical protein
MVVPDHQELPFTGRVQQRPHVHCDGSDTHSGDGGVNAEAHFSRKRKCWSNEKELFKIWKDPQCTILIGGFYYRIAL